MKARVELVGNMTVTQCTALPRSSPCECSEALETRDPFLNENANTVHDGGINQHGAELGGGRDESSICKK